MRENFENRLYDGEEFLYWQKVNALQEQLGLLNRVPENAINRAAHTLLDLRESWEWATKKERQELVKMMLQEIAYDIETTQIKWLKVRPDFEILFQILEGLHADTEHSYWLGSFVNLPGILEVIAH